MIGSVVITVNIEYISRENLVIHIDKTFYLFSVAIEQLSQTNHDATALFYFTNDTYPTQIWALNAIPTAPESTKKVG